MAKLVIGGFKHLELGDLMRFGGSKFYLDTFKTKEAKFKAEEVKSNKVYLALFKALKDTGSYAFGLGDISRSKDIWLELNGIPVKMLKATATDSDSTPVSNMSLCCNGEVGLKKYCKSCQKDIAEEGKMIKIGKEAKIPIPKDKLEEIRAIRQKPYAVFADDKGLCLTEMYYPSKIRTHSVDTTGYTITPEEAEMVKRSVLNAKTDYDFVDDYAERLKEFIANPTVFVSVEEKIAKDFNMAELFGQKVAV